MIREKRPDPDELLAQLQQPEEKILRGKLRIYLGASAGVGKTFAMLNAAHGALKEGKNVLIGIIESHGRSETAALVSDLPALPPRSVIYRGTTLYDFNLDEALRSHPDLLLLDELAHTNAEGARHPKRWQDAEELLAAGIDVWSTLNIQHLESLNEAVSSITGARVFETVPDTLLNRADEVVLVDVPVDELLNRLQAGKIYAAPQATRAAQNFFRKGNLIALREMALRRTADRIESDVQNYRIEKAITQVWKTDPTLLACIGPHQGSEHIVRNTARLATEMGARWHAAYVETPRLQRLPRSERERILSVLKLAENLGAHTAVLTGNDAPACIVEYASSHNLSKIIVGRPQTSSLKWITAWPWSFQSRLMALVPEMDIVSLAFSTIRSRRLAIALPQSVDEEAKSGISSYLPYLWVILACALTTLISWPLLHVIDLSNIVMLFLLTVVLLALKLGRGPAVLAAFLSVASFDVFFVPPRFSFAVSDIQYLLTFIVMLVVALIIGQLTAGLRFQARIATHREERARTLFELARDLSGVLQKERIVEISTEVIEKSFNARVALIIPDEQDQLQILAPHTLPPGLDQTIAQWALEKGEMAGCATNTLPSNPYRYLPLRAPMRIRGVLAITLNQPRWFLIPEQQRQLDTFCSLIAIALERVHYVDVAQNALLRMESERLRNSLLAAISHDLRTPLTALIGLADTLNVTQPPLSPEHAVLAEAIREEATRMNMLVNNLLDMARLQSGDIHLKREWHSIEEVIGTALYSLRRVLDRRTITVQLAPNLPLVEFDAVLIERVLVNVLENAAKYTPAHSPIRLEAQVIDDFLHVSIIDHGPGLPPGWEENIFEKFTRVEAESAIPGVGLGLAICRAIIESHQGKIWAKNLPEGGACFTFTLPVGHPPELAPYDDAE